jgi:hypothetical protein
MSQFDLRARFGEILMGIADRATPGPWEKWQEADGDWSVGRPEEVPDEEGDGSALVAMTMGEGDAEFIAAFDPGMAKALLQEMVILAKLLTEAVDAHDKIVLAYRTGGHRTPAVAIDKMREIKDQIGWPA